MEDGVLSDELRENVDYNSLYFEVKSHVFFLETNQMHPNAQYKRLLDNI